MISYLVDAVLLLALLITSFRMGAIYRELKRLRSYHDEYRRVFDQTARALADARLAVYALNSAGSEIVYALGERIDEAQELIGQLDVAARLARIEPVLDRLKQGQNPAGAEAPVTGRSLVVETSPTVAGRYREYRPAARRSVADSGTPAEAS